MIRETLPKSDLMVYSQLSDKKKRNFDDVIAEGVVMAEANSENFKIREIALEVRRLGRPLSDEEMEKFRVR